MDSVQLAVPMVVGYFILCGIAQKPIAQRIVHNNDDSPKTISSFNSDGRGENLPPFDIIWGLLSSCPK